MDERFIREEGPDVFTGNELILKGALESGCALITGYPGSPVSDVFDAAVANNDLLKKHGILAELANNEALSVARLNGARMAGVRAMAIMKSVGLHVAADGLALGNLSEPNNQGGSIVVVGDDPWIESTQINNDSRFLSQHLHMPVLEPATFQELKDWVGIAFELSSRSNLYITYLVTTNQADGGGTVWVHPNHYPTVHAQAPVTLDTSRIQLENQVLLPPRTWSREATLPQRFDIFLAEVRHRRINRMILPSAEVKTQMPSIGFVAAGLSYCYLEHSLAEMGLSGVFPILKLGVSYPLDSEAILRLAENVETVIVVEEKRGFIEQQITHILHEARQTKRFIKEVDVWGKKFPNGLAGFPELRGINASVVMQTLIPFLLSYPVSAEWRGRLEAEWALLSAAPSSGATLPVRTPTFCPGCPHRDSSSVFLQIKKDFMDADYMRRTHRQKPLDLVFHGETGCFTMLMFEPNRDLMHNYSGMGLGGGTGAGADPFITNKQVVFLGDSTFFHSGMIAISDSIKSGQDITYVILDNKTTAMTGHQPTPGTEQNLMGETTFTQSIETIVQAMASANDIPVTRVNPEFRDPYRQLLEETILKEGVKVIIADKECGLTYHRRRKKERRREALRSGFLAEERHVNITPEVCEFCLECTNVTGCPGLTVEKTLYGPKIVTDQTHCVSDGACAKVKACPSFEDVIVKRRKPRTHVPILPSLQGLPTPPVRLLESGPWYCYTAGVGGMGAGVVSAVLVQAAHLEGHRILFSDKKGLAVRNGGVYAHIIVTRRGGVLSPLVPYGKADLMLGIDLLETARGADPSIPLRVADSKRTSAVVNTAVNPTILMLMGRDQPDLRHVEESLKRAVRPEGYWGTDLSAMSQYYFGSKLYANMLLLGAAAQRGELPFSIESLETAIARSVPREDKTVNLQAFHAGRLLVFRPEAFDMPVKTYTYQSLFEEKKRILAAHRNAATSNAYRILVEDAALQLELNDQTLRDLALRVYDLIWYDDVALAERYIKIVLSTAQKDRRQWNYDATKTVLYNAFKVMAIKDEVYVAHLLTSPEKRERDRWRFGVDESNGDKIMYRHLTRPEFVLFGRSFRWDMVTRDWQLRLMKRFKWLRRLLPQWHRAEKEFRDWYLGIVDCFEADNEADYRSWVRILCCPESVRGYREIRLPRMQEAQRDARQRMKDLLTRSSATVAQKLSAYCHGARP